MNHANDQNFDDIMSIFHQHKSWFGHIRSDYIRQTIINNSKKFNFTSNLTSKNKSSTLTIFEDNVIITYNIYKVNKKIGNVQAKKGDCILHQIGAKNRDGSAARILNKFFEYIDSDVLLSVRRDNVYAKKFYEKNQMKLVGETFWSNNTIPGDIYRYAKSIR